MRPTSTQQYHDTEPGPPFQRMPGLLKKQLKSIETARLNATGLKSITIVPMSMAREWRGQGC